MKSTWKILIVIPIIILIILVYIGINKKTFLEIQINGQPTSGITCESITPAFTLVSDSQGIIKFDSEIFKSKNQEFFLKFSENNNPMFKSYFSLERGSRVILNFNNGVLIVRTIKGWAWFKVDETKTISFELIH